MASEDPSDGLPGHVRFLLLVVAVVIAGVGLYALFPFLPAAVQVFVMLAACVIATRGNPTPDDEKTLASLVCGYIAVFVYICVTCVIVWESIRPSIARDDAEFRVWFVASCLVAGLRLLDGRVSFGE
jgi:hypothetical protein